MPQPTSPVPNPNESFIFRPWRRDPKTGAILWARNYGLRAWRIPVTSGNGPAPATN